QGRADHLFERHARDLDRILHGEEESALRALPRGEAQELLTVDRDGTVCHLIVAAAHHRMGERRLSGAVRTHQRVHLAGAHVQVDAPKNLVAGDGRVEIGDAQHVLGTHGSTTETSSPSTCVAYTATGRVAGSGCGSPVINEKVEPCFGHSISRSSSHTSPSESE